MTRRARSLGSARNELLLTGYAGSAARARSRILSRVLGGMHAASVSRDEVRGGVGHDQSKKHGGGVALDGVSVLPGLAGGWLDVVSAFLCRFVAPMGGVIAGASMHEFVVCT